MGGPSRRRKVFCAVSNTIHRVVCPSCYNTCQDGVRLPPAPRSRWSLHDKISPELRHRIGAELSTRLELHCYTPNASYHIPKFYCRSQHNPHHTFTPRHASHMQREKGPRIAGNDATCERGPLFFSFFLLLLRRLTFFYDHSPLRIHTGPR